MQFFEYGKPDGVPLVFLSGTPHTEDSVAELAELAAETGVRRLFRGRTRGPSLLADEAAA